MRAVLYLAGHALSVLVADFASIYWRSGTRGNWGMALTHLDALFLTVVSVPTVRNSASRCVSAIPQLARVPERQ